MNDPDDCLVAWCPCGGLALATDPTLEDTGDEVALMVWRGYRVSRMAAAEVRAARWCFGGGCGKRLDPRKAVAP